MRYSTLYVYIHLRGPVFRVFCLYLGWSAINALLQATCVYFPSTDELNVVIASTIMANPPENARLTQAAKDALAGKPVVAMGSDPVQVIVLSFCCIFLIFLCGCA